MMMMMMVMMIIIITNLEVTKSRNYRKQPYCTLHTAHILRKVLM
jgi:hypothetical protein